MISLERVQDAFRMHHDITKDTQIRGIGELSLMQAEVHILHVVGCRQVQPFQLRFADSGFYIA
ncbi:hypothetical protein D3C76_1795520 [compost metagenome]